MILLSKKLPAGANTGGQFFISYIKKNIKKQ